MKTNLLFYLFINRLKLITYLIKKKKMSNNKKKL